MVGRLCHGGGAARDVPAVDGVGGEGVGRDREDGFSLLRLRGGGGLAFDAAQFDFDSTLAQRSGDGLAFDACFDFDGTLAEGLHRLRGTTPVLARSRAAASALLARRNSLCVRVMC